jgi:hypothetical protein
METQISIDMATGFWYVTTEGSIYELVEGAR